MYVLEVRNAELIESITKQAAEHATYTPVVSFIGSVDSLTLSTTPAADLQEDRQGE